MLETVLFAADTVGTSLPEAIKSVDFSSLTQTIEAVIPIALPISVGLVGIRKGISFLLSMIRGA